MSIPGQRSAQPARRAALAVQRALGRAATAAGVLCTEIGVTDLETGRRAVLSVDDQGRETWTDDTGAVVWARADDENEE